MGQKLCCTESSIKVTDFGKPGEYGQCKEGECAADGDEVSMNLYKNPRRQKQNDISTLDELCCSGQAGETYCSSATGIDESGNRVYGGTCSGTCGADDEASVMFRI